MDCAGFEDIAGIDVGLFCLALRGAELYDWCALQQACKWSHAAVASTLPLLKDDRKSGVSGSCDKEVLDCCRNGDVTGIWARVKPGEELFLPDAIRGDSNENSLLHIAASRPNRKVAQGHSFMLRWLASRRGAQRVVQHKNLRGQTPLHICSRSGCEEVTRLFLGLSVDKEAKDIYESTPLLDAVREEHPNVVKLLLEHSANVNAFIPNCHGHGESPLILAVRLKNEEITNLLLKTKDIDLYQKSITDVPFSNEALDFAVAGSRIHNLLENAIEERAAVEAARKSEVAQLLHHAHWPARNSAPEGENCLGPKKLKRFADKHASGFLVAWAGWICSMSG
jgi:ankyrin repeat protein